MPEASVPQASRPCPDTETLASYVDARLDAEARDAVTTHLSECGACYELVSESLRTEQEVGAMDDVSPREGSRSARLPAGRRWVIAAGAGLAAAAVLVIVASVEPMWWGRFRDRSIDSGLAPLVSAVGERRFVDGRLAGGFKFGPLRSPLRSGRDLQTEDLTLLSAAAELQKRAEMDPTAPNLHRWGTAQLILGDADQAIAVLDRARGMTPDPPATLLSDLSAAFAARAKFQNRAADWPLAASFAQRALDKDRGLAEAAFNLAIALEGLGLTEQAREAWQRYLEADGQSPWAAEARQRLNTPPGEAQTYEEDRRRLESTRTIETVESVAIRNPQVVRDWIEEAVLPAWAKSCADSPADASQLLALAESAAAVTAKRQTDTYLSDIVAAFSSQGEPCDAAGAMANYARARTLYLAGEYLEAEGAFGAVSQSALVPVPLKDLAVFYRSLVPYFQGRFDETRTALLELSDRIPSRDSLLQGRIQWMLGIIAVGQGRYPDALGHYRSALRTFERRSESEGIAQAHNLLAEVLRDMGDERWWDHLVLAHGLAPLIRPQRRHALFLNAVQGSLLSGLPAIAMRYQRRVASNARELRHPSLIAESLQWEFVLRQHIAGDATANQTLEAARREMAALPDGGLRLRFSAELAALEADAAVKTEPQRALEAATRAIRIFGEEGRERRLPLLHLLTARAHVALGQPELALAELRKGLRLLETQGQRLSAYARAAFIDERWRLLELAVAVLVEMDPDGMQALDLLDRYRRSSSGAPASLDASDANQPLSAPARVALIQYLALEDRLLVWSMTPTGGQLRTVTVRRDDVVAAVGRFKSSILSRLGGRAVDEHLRNIAQMVLWPAVDDLGGTDLVFVVPDGALGEVPFAALPLRDGRRLADRFELVAAASFKSGLGWLAKQQAGSGTGGSVLVAAVSDAPGTSGLAPLAAASTEARAIARLHPPQRTTLLINPTADEFERHVGGKQVVHFAGHATLAPRFPFTGALHFAADAAGDTMLTAERLGALDLRRTEVVVLAACTTGNSVATRSAGLLGLSSTLLNAGAGAVVASLWRVDDQRTASLMVSFHRRLQNGHAPPNALRHAQREARALDESDVAQWSAWVVFVGADSTAHVRQ